jgi:Xaa-Pro aminopeptidase
MFDASVYTKRRNQLKKQLKDGLVLFLGNEESPMNYPANPYHFRQDSSFLYFFGLDSPGLAGVIDIDEERDIIFGNDVEMEDVIWMGYQPLLKQRAEAIGVQETFPLDELGEMLKSAFAKGKSIHFLPPYRPETAMKLERLLGIKAGHVNDYASEVLVKAVVGQRSVKSPEEVEQIEIAMDASYDMHTTAMKMAIPGVFEYEIAGMIEGIALSHGGNIAFPVILSINGQILHNHDHSNKLEKGRLMVNDSGAESPMHYASDITRTTPVGGKFTEKQKDIYQIVLDSQLAAIDSVKPGVKNKDMHLKSSQVITEGLKQLGLMKGNVDEAVSQGAHALFMPHGLGHMMGLDVHDMEDVGENYVGYDQNIQRSDQFGLAYLRLARELKPGFVMTVEPGIYFIPALIDKWKNENKFREFIDYEKVNSYRDFGGIRIEDDVLVTESSGRILGRKPIPKTVKEVEAIAGTG